MDKVYDNSQISNIITIPKEYLAEQKIDSINFSLSKSGIKNWLKILLKNGLNLFCFN